MEHKLFKSKWPLRIFNIFLLLLCLVSILAEFVLHAEHHLHFSVEAWPGLYALVGFLSFVFIVFFSKYILRPLVMRPILEEGSDA